MSRALRKCSLLAYINSNNQTKHAEKETNQSRQTERKVLESTSNIRAAKPSLTTIKKTRKLEETLKLYDTYETEEELNHKAAVIDKVNNLVINWIKYVCIQKNVPPEVAETVGGQIYTFGSYSLGVHNKEGDIDALCVAPCYVDRDSFFTSFFQVLKARPEVTGLRAIPTAHVPIIKMKFDGIEFDMIFARLALEKIPPKMDLSDETLLTNLNEKCILSLNGCRVTNEILRLVPDKDNFRLTLRVIKLWAKQRGIYSNVFGYLGGVSWAILVAKVCKLYPNAAAASLVNKFFYVYTNWNWLHPITLTTTNSWMPQTYLDRNNVMPIITPTFPQQNSSYNVFRFTKNIILTELNRAKLLTDKIMFDSTKWCELFEELKYFEKYEHFTVLKCVSKLKDHLEWSGFVESQIRFLIVPLEEKPCFKKIHMNPKSYPDLELNSDEKTCYWFIGFLSDRIEKLYEILNLAIPAYISTVYGRAHAINLYKPGMTIEAQLMRKDQLNGYLPPHILNNINKNDKNKNNTLTDTTIQGLLESENSFVPAVNVVPFLPPVDKNSYSAILKSGKRVSNEMLPKKVKKVCTELSTTVNINDSVQMVQNPVNKSMGTNSTILSVNPPPVNSVTYSAAMKPGKRVSDDKLAINVKKVCAESNSTINSCKNGNNLVKSLENKEPKGNFSHGAPKSIDLVNNNSNKKNGSEKSAGFYKKQAKRSVTANMSGIVASNTTKNSVRLNINERSKHRR